jgi:hypothetical protein
MEYQKRARERLKHPKGYKGEAAHTVHRPQLLLNYNIGDRLVRTDLYETARTTWLT